MSKQYPNLMKPLKVTDKLTLKNRLSVAPTGSFFLMYGEKGDYTFNMMDYLCERALGGFGLIMRTEKVPGPLLFPRWTN